ncbi:unnamed protein product [Acanthosepion pharaonis]|uniref:Uncharacterized protein n=1 Tax=Acanthosepion pharaonis TaxID=158019 RepID=A0A812BQP0_ACAPH|nr:unnamed protein product [Sepia pharaonis]
MVAMVAPPQGTPFDDQWAQLVSRPMMIASQDDSHSNYLKHLYLLHRSFHFSFSSFSFGVFFLPLNFLRLPFFLSLFSFFSLSLSIIFQTLNFLCFHFSITSVSIFPTFPVSHLSSSLSFFYFIPFSFRSQFFLSFLLLSPLYLIFSLSLSLPSFCLSHSYFCIPFFSLLLFIFHSLDFYSPFNLSLSFNIISSFLLILIQLSLSLSLFLLFSSSFVIPYSLPFHFVFIPSSHSFIIILINHFYSPFTLSLSLSLSFLSPQIVITGFFPRCPFLFSSSSFFNFSHNANHSSFFLIYKFFLKPHLRDVWRLLLIRTADH